MVKLKVFLICISVILAVFSLIACMETYTLERAIARGFYHDLLDDMEDIGYLDNQLAQYYSNKMEGMGWQPIEDDFFAGTWPRDETIRARKENNESIYLSIQIRPSKVSEWVHYLFEGEPVFRFSGSRPSEYFSPGW